MMSTCMTYAPRITVRRTFLHDVAPIIVPPHLKANSDVLTLAVTSGVQGEAFTRLLGEMERCHSIVTVIGALYEHGTKIKNCRAWLIDNRFGVDLCVMVASEIYAHDKHFISLHVAVKHGDNDNVYDIGQWAMVEIGHS